MMLLAVSVSRAHGAGIEVYPKNPTYWQYDGKPVILLGCGGNMNDAFYQCSDPG